MGFVEERKVGGGEQRLGGDREQGKGVSRSRERPTSVTHEWGGLLLCFYLSGRVGGADKWAWAYGEDWRSFIYEVPGQEQSLLSCPLWAGDNKHLVIRLPLGRGW